MNYIIRNPWQLPQRKHTPEEVFLNRKAHRRDFLKLLGMGAAGLGLEESFSGCNGGTDEEIRKAGSYDPVPTAERSLDDALSAEELSSVAAGTYPAKRNEKFEYGRAETMENVAARYTNFYEFSGDKQTWRYIRDFKPVPWRVEIDGLCAQPRTFDLDDIHRAMQFEERHYRHRCVETWAMCVPWTGFPLRDLLKQVEPLPAARFVAFQTIHRPSETPNVMGSAEYPWPYTEGLTLEEASNELAFIATGMYGHPLLKQHGAPIRLVIPWKYGYKSIKSIVRITLTDRQPATFWNTIQPKEYDFAANVNPLVPHPRWSQRHEKMLGSNERFQTVIYNGYGEWVARLYPA